MSLKSLNQIVDRLRSLALSHKQVNNFYYGDLPEFDAGADITYPGVFLESVPGSIDRTLRQQRFNFRVYFLDLVNVSQDTKLNETEVLSDMSRVAADFMSMVLNPEYQYDWEPVDSGSIQLVTEVLGDMDAGAVMDIGINIEYLADICEVPADGIIIPSDFDMARTRLYTYDAAGTEVDSFPVGFLSGKPVIGVFRAGQYKRPVAVAPVSFDQIQVGTTDLGSGKGIEGNGTIVLMTGDGLVPGEQIDFLYYE